MIKSTGFVKFPDQESDVLSTEHGLDVFLVVLYDNQKEWFNCTTTSVQMIAGNLLGDHRQARDAIVQRYWPHLHERHDAQSVEYLESILSVDFMCAIALGSTNRAFGNVDKTDYWRCTQYDLTDDGKILLGLVEKLYPNHEWVILTFLDT